MGDAVKLSSLDAAFLYMETPEMPMHVGSLSVFQLPKGYQGDFFEAFKAQIADRLDAAPMLKRKLARTVLDIDHPSWVEDEQFDINRQMFRGSLAAPADLETLRRTVGWMHAKLLNRARPLWEFYLFENMPGDQVGLYVKIHHALIDGGAGVALTQIIYDTVANPPPRPKAKAGVKEKPTVRAAAASAVETYVRLWQKPFSSEVTTFKLPRSGKTDLGSVLRDHATTQLELGLNVAAALPAMAGAAVKALPGLLDPAKLGDLRNVVAPRTPLNKSISSERAFGTATISLTRARSVGKAAGGKLNDVVLALSSGVLRRYLLETDTLPKKSLSAAVPVSLREEGNGETNNQAFAMTCQIATHIADPKDRMAMIIAESTKSKALISPLKDFIPLVSNASAIGMPMTMQVMALLYTRSGVSDILPPTANVIVSNVPGPRMSLYAAGAELLHLFPVSIATHGMALNITVQGYRDQLEFGLIAGANVLPDVQRLADMLEEELAVLEEAYASVAA